jgi:hypothetical protein
LKLNPEKCLFLGIADYSPLTWGSRACLSSIQLSRNEFDNTNQRATLVGIDLYFKGNRPTLQQLCPPPQINLLCLKPKITVLLTAHLFNRAVRSTGIFSIINHHSIAIIHDYWTVMANKIHEKGYETGQEINIMRSLTLLVLTIINYNDNDVDVDVDVDIDIDVDVVCAW